MILIGLQSVLESVDKRKTSSLIESDHVDKQRIVTIQKNLEGSRIWMHNLHEKINKDHLIISLLIRIFR